ncbi:MAG: SGNH/GDSL hydrolase family protein [Candidatus Accumulibacter meliphilus]|jgi:lysophospholipase L1-like esterase|uniref:SGNH/GDSL hydrolase family protein n=1 Tax=Candidatus Accumulibacter meliphilus TaxID=2211374 RepID=UPI002FC2DC60
MADETRRKEVITGLLVFLMFFGFFIAGELALRLIQFNKFGQLESVEKDDSYYVDEETGLRLNKPNLQLGSSRINNLGFRGPDIGAEKPLSTVRLAFLGSSTTYDANSGEEENWPRLVAKNIDEALTGCSTDFINAGKAGYGTEQMATLYMHFVKQTEPDLVFVLPGDLSQDLDWLAGQHKIDTHHDSYESFLAKHSILLEKLEKNIRIIQLQRRAGSKKDKLSFDPKEIEHRFRARLEHLIEAIVKDGRDAVLITTSGQIRRDMSISEMVAAGNTAIYYMPYIYLPDLIKLRDSYNAVIREVAHKYGVILVDTEDSIPGTPAYYADAIHFTPAGSKAMAKAVTSSLQGTEAAHSIFEKLGCKFSNQDRPR